MTSLVGKSLILIGGGGHAKVLVDSVVAQGGTIGGYVDPQPAAWLDTLSIPHINETDISQSAQLIIGFVGLDCVALRKRYHLMQNYQKQGFHFPTLIHPAAIISQNAHIAEGAQILPGVIINAYANIHTGAIINSSAVIEHDAVIDAGAHIAPSATVLGGAHIGECAYVGSQAVVLQNSKLMPDTFVKALTVHK